MPASWDAVADRTDGDYSVDDFKQAMYQLVSQQCLYRRFSQHSVAYRLIVRHEKEFKDVADMMGLKLAVNTRHEYCYVRQDVAKPAPMDLAETLFLLVLRQLYHQHANAGSLTDEGDAIVNLAELIETYKQSTGRDLDHRLVTLRSLLKSAQRCGIARETKEIEDDPQPFAIAILPGITDILSEYAINRFGADLKANLARHAESRVLVAVHSDEPTETEQ